MPYGTKDGECWHATAQCFALANRNVISVVQGKRSPCKFCTEEGRALRARRKGSGSANVTGGGMAADGTYDESAYKWDDPYTELIEAKRRESLRKGSELSLSGQASIAHSEGCPQPEMFAPSVIAERAEDIQTRHMSTMLGAILAQGEGQIPQADLLAVGVSQLASARMRMVPPKVLSGLKAEKQYRGLGELATLRPEVQPYLMGATREILRRQFEARATDANAKALQAGQIQEALMADNLSLAFGLRELWTPESGTGLPPEVRSRFGDDAPPEKANFVYYDKDSDIVIALFGAPELGDIRLWHGDRMLQIEVKEPEARLGEYDLILDEDDHAVGIAHKEGREELEETISPVVERFNETYESVQDARQALGGNFKMLVDENRAIAGAYLASGNINLIMSNNGKGEPLLIPTAAVLASDAIECSGGEVRTKGRNGKVPERQRVLTVVGRTEGLAVDDDGLVHVLDDNALTDVHKRQGNGEVSRQELQGNDRFYVPVDAISVDENGQRTFPLKAIKELKPSIAAKINFKKVSPADIAAACTQLLEA